MWDTLLFSFSAGLTSLQDFCRFDPYILTFIFIAFFSFAYSFYAIRQPEMLDYPGCTTGRRLYCGTGRAEKYAKSGLRKEQAEEYLTKLLSYMDDEKPYLDGDLTIHDLAKKPASRGIISPRYSMKNTDVTFLLLSMSTGSGKSSAASMIRSISIILLLPLPLTPVSIQNQPLTPSSRPIPAIHPVSTGTT